jgi:hypothetical protein
MNPLRHKFLIKEKNVFTKREYVIYTVIEKMIEDDDNPIEYPIVLYEMKVKDCDVDFNYVIKQAKEGTITTDRIDSYFNTLYREYRNDLFRNTKSTKDIEFAISEAEKIQELTDSIFITAADGFNMLLSEELAIENLNTGLNFFDKKLYLSNGILMLAAGKGAGKTSVVVDLMKRILVNHNKDKNVCIQWNSMEDEIRMIIAKMISSEVGIPAKLLIRKNSRFKEHHKIEMLRSVISGFDIEFQDRQLSMNEILTNWKVFLKQRKKTDNPQKPTFPILIIDNIMQLTDHGNKQNQTADDDYICNRINVCRNEAKKLFGTSYLIIVLHHIGKENFAKDNLKNAFIPDDNSIKGSSRYSDLPTVGLLLHWFGVKDNLLQEMKPFSKYLKNLLYVSCFKNRSGGWIGNDRLFLDLDFNITGNYLEFKE